MIILCILWWLVGFVSFIWSFYDIGVTGFILVMAMLVGVLGPISTLIAFTIRYGDVVLFKKKTTGIKEEETHFCDD